jgi:hypothetical protein
VEANDGEGQESMQTGDSEESAGGKVVAKAGEALEQGKEKAGEVAGQAKGVVSRTVDERSTELGGKIGTVAESTRRMAGQMREEGQDGPAGLADQAAERAERVGSYLRDADGDRLLEDLEGFARRQPWAVAAGAFILGVVGARFLKASAERRSDLDGTYERRENSARQPVSGPSYASQALAGSSSPGRVSAASGAGYGV